MITWKIQGFMGILDVWVYYLGSLAKSKSSFLVNKCFKGIIISTWRCEHVFFEVEI